MATGDQDLVGIRTNMGHQLLGLMKTRSCKIKKGTRTYERPARPGAMVTTARSAVQEPAARVPSLTHQHCTLVRSTLAHVYFQA